MERAMLGPVILEVGPTVSYVCKSSLSDRDSSRSRMRLTMMVIASNTFPNPDISVEADPLASTQGLIEVASERKALGAAFRSSWKKRRRFPVSSGVALPIPAVPGYCHLFVSEDSRMELSTHLPVNVDPIVPSVSAH
jgi:hypothetical protein